MEDIVAQLRVRKLSYTGMDIKITIFGNFRQHKWAIFLKFNVMIFLSQNCQFFEKLIKKINIGVNIFFSF
jgi:hypothetical protein